MDVKKLFVLSILPLFFAGCGSENKNPQPKDQFIKRTDDDCEGLRIKNQYLVRWKSGKTTLVQAESDDEFVQGFVTSNTDAIDFSEPHYQVQIDQSEMLNQRGWGGDINWGVDAVEAQALWDNKSAGQDMIVAVIDSGLDVFHPQLVDALYVNPKEEENGLDDDGNGYIDDIHGYNFVADSGKVKDYTGHGTHVAGIIAAQHDGPVLGVAPRVKIMPLSFIGEGGGGSIFSAIKAMQYAQAQGAQVINASWGGNFCSAILKEEIDALAEANVLFVAAAGNSGNDIEVFPEYPAAFSLSNMLVVGASTVDQKTAGFSNYGKLVDIVAPGANIYSTFPAEFDEKDGTKDGVVSLNGTSMATPFVAAAAALLWSLEPGASYAKIKQALTQGVIPGPYPVESKGQLHLPSAMDALENL